MEALHDNPSKSFAGRVYSGLALPSPRAPADRAGAAVTAVLVIFAAVTAFRVWSNVRYPYVLDLGEGAVLSSAWKAACGKPVYQALGEPPFTLTVYHPIFIYLSGLAFQFFGPAAAGPRMIAAAFFALCALLVYLFVRRETSSPSAAFVAALFLIVERHFVSRAGHALTDFPALFFSLAGLYLWRSGGRARYLAVVSFALAFFTKQISLVAAAAAFLSLFIEGGRRESIGLMAVFLAVLGAGLAAAGFLFGSAFFTSTFSYASVAPFSAAVAARSAGIAIALYAVLVGGWLFMLLRAPKRREYLLPALYVLFGFLVSVTSGRQGASRSYFFDFGAGLALVAGYQWALIRRLRPGRLAKIAVAAAALQAALVGVGAFYRMSPLGDKTSSDAAHDAEVKAVFDSQAGMILSREMGFEAGTNAVAATTDIYKTLQLMEAGVLVRDVFVEPVRRKAFSAIIVPESQRQREPFNGILMDAIEANYVLDHRAHGELFFFPAAEQGAR